jgi:hypothetical protein
MIETIKEVLGWMAVLALFAAIVAIVATGGGALSPDYWNLVFYK